LRTLIKLGVAAVAGFSALQLVRSSVPVSPAGTEIQVPSAVHMVLEKDCYSCHSNERRLAWFDQVVPSYWLMRHDILTAREHLNFSRVGSKPVLVQRAALFEAVNMIRLGVMPLRSYTALHPDAKVTPEELATLQAYLAPWNAMPAAGGGQGAREPATSLASVAAEFNGLAFDPGFESWKPISFTDRGDNNTLRLILGNDIAVRAARSGQIDPWPNGSRFAKIAWQQESAPDGLIHPGEFVQVELMVKDARLYRRTAGWGWGRWRGLHLTPYGNDAKFTGECVSCHMPLKGADYVYTLPLTRADVGGEETVNRRAANLPQSLPWQPLEWGTITMYVDRASRTMAVLFGNEEALRVARAWNAGAGRPPAYGAGAVLALVAWDQRDDPHWFGARIPDAPQSVEFISTSARGTRFDYRRFEGSGLPERTLPFELAQQRIDTILKLAPAALP